MQSLLFETKALLRQHQVNPSRRLGQSFLVDPIHIRRLVDSLQLSSADHVLEVGPGTGNITAALLATRAQVTAIEIDPRLVDLLTLRFKGIGNFTIFQGDAASFTPPHVTKVLGNLPFSAASAILFHLAELRIPFMTLTFQEEFVDRMLAKPGTATYGRLSVMSQYWFNIKIIDRLPPAVFYPVPAVASATVMLSPKPPIIGVAVFPTFQKVVNHLFTHRRQYVRKALNQKTETGKPPNWRTKLSDSIPFFDRQVFSLTLDELKQIAEWIVNNHITE